VRSQNPVESNREYQPQVNFNRNRLDSLSVYRIRRAQYDRLSQQHLSLLLIIIGGFSYSVFCGYVEFTSVHFMLQNGLMNDKNAIA